MSTTPSNPEQAAPSSSVSSQQHAASSAKRLATNASASSSRSPPPKINLNDLKPIISTTPANTSSNGALKPSTAFVFTSSRTLRNLHNYQSIGGDSILLPPPDIYSPTEQPLAPSSSNVASVSEGTKSLAIKPILSQAQLARHSLGAVDARCIVSSNMRAAGFQPLTHTPPADPSAPPTPSVAAVPTPKDPPRFPPIVFLNPTHVSATSMWDYQQHLPYGLGAGPGTGIGYSYGEASNLQSTDTSSASSIPPVNDPSAVVAASALSPSSPRIPSAGDSFSSLSTQSSSSLFSAISGSSSGLTSVPSSNLQTSARILNPLNERFKVFAEGQSSVPDREKHVVDGYPFPRTRLGSAEDVSRPLYHETTSYSSQVTSSPSVSSSTASGSVTPMAQSPLSLPSPIQEAPPPPSLVVERPHPKPVQPKTPSFKSKAAKERDRNRPRNRYEGVGGREPMSLTKLISSSSFTWQANPVVTSHSSGAATSSGSFSSASISAASSTGANRNRTRKSMRASTPSATSGTSVTSGSSDLRRTVDGSILDEASSTTTPAGGSSSETVVSVGEVKGIDRGQQSVAVDINLPKTDSGSEKGSHRGRQRGRDRDRELEREKRRELRRLKGKMREADMAAADGVLAMKSSSKSSKSKSSSGTSSGSSDKGSAGKSQRSPRTKKDKTRSTKEKHAASGFVSVFPPKNANPGLEHPHTLGEYDAKLARERKREAGEFAKDQVYAHRERDREHARLTEQWSARDDIASDPSKRHGSLSAAKAAASAIAYASSHHAARGRGRGRGRGELPSARGRSVSVVSVLSDGETVVDDAVGAIEQLELESAVEA
ncbi:hypothetical protein BDW22DRAFT_1425119 [Trametopsis cervina]|nr:hypothetical protein BDW22DRAFT_1425119 [Trametopsis cervina]